MAETQLIELLINGGANAAFAGFLLWQFFYQQKRLDARDKRSEAREDSLRERYEKDQAQLRSRYDEVIKMYQDKEERTRESIVNEISKLDTQMDQVEKKVDELSSRLLSLSEAVQELKLREIARSQLNGIAPPPQI
jgi:chromosome segregation ATPase